MSSEYDPRQCDEHPGTGAPPDVSERTFPEDDPLAPTLDEEVEDGRAAAILAYVPFGCFVALVRYRDNKFARRHGVQGLMLTFLEVLAGLFLIPRISEYFWVTVVFACLASAVMGIYRALQGRSWTVPFAGDWFANHVNIDAAISRAADDVDRNL